MFRRRAIRLILWLAVLASAELSARPVRVAIGQPRGERPLPSGEYTQYARKVTTRLRTLGVSCQEIADDALSAETLTGGGVLIFPYNPALPERALEAVRAFQAGGGEIILFYHSDPGLLGLLGIPQVRYVGRQEVAGLTQIAYDAIAPPGLPPLAAQPVRNLLEPVLPETEAGSARIMARLAGMDGTLSSRIAAVRTQNGYYFSQVYQEGERRQAERFWLALLGAGQPALWQTAAMAASERIGTLFGRRNLDDLATWCREFSSLDASEKLEQARVLQERGSAALAAGDGREAYEAFDEAASLARQAFVLSCPSREGEFRGVWIHSPYGIADWGWDKTIQVLARHGFNAVFPNMLWGYVAEYPSAVLPPHPDNQGRDLLQECLDACRRYQVALHVWKVNWNMGHRTPAELRRKMREAGRTQVSASGEPSDFLLPHLPENFQLERDSMLELVRKYPVDGIHFDYIRYPGGTYDFSASSRQAFEAASGETVGAWPGECREGGRLFAAYNAWRRENITRLVREVSVEARRLRPEVKISAAVYGNWEGARDSIAQDAAAWVGEGLLDFICPMNYTADSRDFVTWLSAQSVAVANRIPIYPGIAAYMQHDAAGVAEQILLSRKMGGDGFVCFQHTAAFAQEVLPQLRLGVTALDVRSPSLLYARPLPVVFKPGEDAELLLGQYSLRESVQAEVTLPADLHYPSLRLKFLRDGVEDQSAGLLDFTRRGQLLFVRMDMQKSGSYRLELRGFEREGAEVLERSGVFRVLNADEEDRLRLEQSPPPFGPDSGRLRVGVWQWNAYGSREILRYLQSLEGIEVLPLLNLRSASLQACQVVVLPQPRARSGLFRQADTLAALQDYVRAGGGLLSLHALVGIRGFSNPLAEVVGGCLLPPSTRSDWQAVAGHPLSAGLTGSVWQSGFSDSIGLRPVRESDVAARNGAGQAVVVAGPAGGGRYVACGLGLGIAPGDLDAALTSPEQRLLHNAVLWLGGRPPP